MASQTAMENMRLCSNSWPIDYDLLQQAIAKQAQHRLALENLLDRVEDGMCEKYRLDHRIPHQPILAVIEKHQPRHRHQSPHYD